jgi:hypothetical protein
MRLKLWAAFAASSLVGITLIHAPEARADSGDRFGNAEEKSRKKADKDDKERDRDRGDKDKGGKDAKAGKGKDAKDGKEKDRGGKRIALSPQGLKYDMSLEAIARLYDKAFDEEYLPLYKKASPGPETEALDAQIKQKKAEVRRSKVEFGQTPTGVDQTPLKGEYSYANGESMGRMTLRSGTERYFFFFSDRLWKVYDAHQLKKGTPLGETFDEAVKSLGPKFGGPGKRVPANPAQGQNFDEVHWLTADMLIRAVNRGDIIAVVYCDRDVQDKLPSMRKNKMKDEHAMDRDVAAALKSKEAPPDPKKDKDKKDEKGKGKK